MLYELVKSNAEILKTKMEDFDFEKPPIDPLELATNLLETMNASGGYGLSANQCGLPYNVFVMKAETPFVCFNPRVVMYGEEMVSLEEGCLSFPNLIFKINRPKHIKVRFQTLDGSVVTKTFTGMTARCFEHEMLHLDGKFFFEGVSRLKMDKALKYAKKRGNDYSAMNLLKYVS